MMDVGLIGAGVMGLAAAGKIIDGGHRLLVFDVRRASMERAGKMNASPVAAPREAAERSDMILLFLPGPQDVRHAVSGKGGLLEGAHRGTVIVDMSTVDPGVTTTMALLAEEQGVGYLDAPVLGRPDAVGKWALPVGGRSDDLDRCRPVLELLAGYIVHAGPWGTGNKIKLLNQMMFGAINAMTAEMMATAEQIGVAPARLYEIITASQAGTVSNLFRELGNRIATDDYENPVFSVDLLAKDIRLAVQMAKENGTAPLLSRLVEFLNEMAQMHGYGSKDTSVMWEVYKNMWKVNGTTSSSSKQTEKMQ